MTEPWKLLGSIVVVLILYLLCWDFIYIARYELRRRQLGYAKLKIVRSWPFGLPFLRRMLRYLDQSILLEKASEESLKSGPVFMSERLFNFPIVVNEPENIKTILATSFKDYSLGRRREHMAAFGDGIFTLSGDGWKHSRAMLRPQFSRDQVSQLHSVDHHANQLIQAILRAQDSQKYVEVQNLFHLLTMDTATDFLFGSSINSLAANEGRIKVVSNGVSIYTDEFVESFVFMLKYTLRRMFLNSLYGLANSKEYRFHTKRARLFVDYYVQRALRETEDYNPDEKDGMPGYTFITELAKVTRDPVVIRDQAFNILIAGRDTTAATSSFMIYHLAQRPDVFSKLREEILTNFGTRYDNVKITFEMLRASQYLQNVIREVLRLAPVVPMNSRTAIRDTKLPLGGGPDFSEPVFVPKGTEVVYNSFLLHRKKEVWGEDAEDFRPERWEHLGEMHPWSYIPFNGGPRICLGQQFALTEISLTMVRLLQRFSKIEADPGLSVTPSNSYSLTIKVGKSGVPVRFIE